jgi:hypothetical protein
LRGAEGLGTQADRLQHALDGGAHQSSSSTTNTCWRRHSCASIITARFLCRSRACLVFALAERS